MKNKKGFTLIELLAVIVILAIIAVIATPIITGIIEDAKKNAAKDSAYGALNAVQSYYSTQLLKDSSITLPITVEWTSGSADKAVTMSGTQPTTGTITLAADGKYCVGTYTPATSTCSASTLTINGYNVTFDYAKQEFTTVVKAS